MKAMQEMSESLNSLSNVISTSFMYAKSSPMKAKQSLMTCAGFLQNTTMKSTSFFIRFCLVLMNFLKNEHLEILILSLISMLENIVALLNSEDCINLVTSCMKLSGSQHIKKLLSNLCKCIKSLFFILKTEEVAAFQKQIWKLIEQEDHDSKDNGNTNTNAHAKNNNACNDLYDMDFDEKDEEKGEIEPSDMSSDDSDCDHGMSIHDDVGNGENDGSKGYWSSLTSVFGYNDTTATNNGDKYAANNNNNTPGAHFVKSSMTTPGCNTNGKRMINNKVKKNKRRKSEPVAYRTFVCKSGSNSPTIAMDHNNYNANNNQPYYNGDMNMNMNMYRKKEVAGIDDWVLLIKYIDDLEDDGDITISEGDEMRKLAFKQNMALLLVYKCYSNKKTRFIRYAVNIYENINGESSRNNIQEEKEKENSNSFYDHEHYN